MWDIFTTLHKKKKGRMKGRKKKRKKGKKEKEKERNKKERKVKKSPCSLLVASLLEKKKDCQVKA